MAQNSISRLAVHITADTSGLAQGFQSAQQQTRRFAQTVEGGTGSLARLGKVGADAAKSFSGMGGTGGLAFKLGGVAGPAGVAAAAITAMAVGLARLADAGEDFRIEKFREVGAIGPEIKTTAEMFADLREQITNFAELSGFSLKPLLADLKELSRSANVLIFGEEAVRNLERQNAEARTALDLFKKKKAEEEAAAKAAEQAAAEAKRRQEALISRGESIAKSLRTPMEVFEDSLRELVELQSMGVISAEILQRGIDKAAEQYRGATGEVKKLKSELRGIPALEEGTAGFRSAVLSSRSSSGSDEVARLTRQQIEIDKQIAASLVTIANKPVVQFKKGTL